MILSKEEVLRLAGMSRISFDEATLERFTHQLTDILTYVEILKEVDTSGVPPTNQVTGLVNVDRPDVIDASVVDKEAFLACSPLTLKDEQIRVNRMIT